MISLNHAYDRIDAQGRRGLYSTGGYGSVPEGNRGLTAVSGTIELSRDEREVRYANIGWTRPAAKFAFSVDGVEVLVSIDALQVSQPLPVTLPVLSNVSRSITTDGLIPSRHLSFSQPDLTGTFDINAGEVTGEFNLPASTIKTPVFNRLGVMRRGSQHIGKVAALADDGMTSKAGSGIQYGYKRRILDGRFSSRIPIDLLLHTIMDRVQVDGRLESGQTTAVA